MNFWYFCFPPRGRVLRDITWVKGEDWALGTKFSDHAAHFGDLLAAVTIRTPEKTARFVQPSKRLQGQSVIDGGGVMNPRVKFFDEFQCQLGRGIPLLFIRAAEIRLFLLETGHALASVFHAHRVQHATFAQLTDAECEARVPCMLNAGDAPEFLAFWHK